MVNAQNCNDHTIFFASAFWDHVNAHQPWLYIGTTVSLPDIFVCIVADVHTEPYCTLSELEDEGSVALLDDFLSSNNASEDNLPKLLRGSSLPVQHDSFDLQLSYCHVDLILWGNNAMPFTDLIIGKKPASGQVLCAETLSAGRPSM